MFQQLRIMFQQLRIILAAIALVACWVAQTPAQNVNWTNPAAGDWNSASNWDADPDAPPETQFGEVGVISNGGTAFVNSSAPNVGGITLGNGGGETGALEIRSGGSLTVISNSESGLETSGAISVGNNGTGLLTVFRGGTLATSGLDTAGELGSLLTLGGTGGSGTATLTVNGLTEFDRTTRIIGPNVDFTTTDIALGTENLLIAEITGLPHSTISATGNATLRGTLQLDFNGHVPQIGDFWDIIDAGNLAGDFALVQSAPDDPLADGVGLLVTKVSGGANGNVARVSVASKLVLTVDAGSGNVTMANLAGGNIDFDGYEIVSSSGSLSPAAWSSLQDQSEPGWLEIGAPSGNLLAELKAGGSTVVGGGGAFDLGNLYQFNPSALGETDDVSFNYSLSNGQVVDGIVKLEGPENNLVLVVNPTTGEGVLHNQSPFTIDLDGYEVRSDGGALNSAGWDSLAGNSGEGGWFELGAPTSNLLAELNPDGARTLSSGDQLPLGDLFTAAASEDLALEFSLATGEIMSGIVKYGDISVPPRADLNNDGIVDGLDLGILLGNFNQNANAAGGELNGTDPVDGLDLGILLGSWTPPSPLGATSVPEPTSIALLALAGTALMATRRGRR